MTTLIIRSDKPEMFSFMKSGLPDGITLEPTIPIIERRDISISASIEFVVTLDLTRIAIDAALIYLLTKGRKLGSKTHICINGDEVSVNNPKAIETVRKKIDTK